mmetsp:Transcript_40547/g.129223  ORF Transcript_40547/g.129223 Transcript_40547/m.129223 type:complete len:215 (+) Transcript_40547:759-1403(+)
MGGCRQTQRCCKEKRVGQRNRCQPLGGQGGWGRTLYPNPPRGSSPGNIGSYVLPSKQPPSPPRRGHHGRCRTCYSLPPWSNCPRVEGWSPGPGSPGGGCGWPTVPRAHCTSWGGCPRPPRTQPPEAGGRAQASSPREAQQAEGRPPGGESLQVIWRTKSNSHPYTELLRDEDTMAVCSPSRLGEEIPHHPIDGRSPLHSLGLGAAPYASGQGFW